MGHLKAKVLRDEWLRITTDINVKAVEIQCEIFPFVISHFFLSFFHSSLYLFHTFITFLPVRSVN
jgi:hypothetical protein